MPSPCCIILRTAVVFASLDFRELSHAQRRRHRSYMEYDVTSARQLGEAERRTRAPSRRLRALMMMRMSRQARLLLLRSPRQTFMGCIVCMCWQEQHPTQHNNTTAFTPSCMYSGSSRTPIQDKGITVTPMHACTLLSELQQVCAMILLFASALVLSAVFVFRQVKPYPLLCSPHLCALG